MSHIEFDIPANLCLFLLAGVSQGFLQYTVTPDSTLTTIPFASIPSTTTELVVDNCAIEDFVSFNYFSAMQSVSLSGNRLTVFPDFANIDGTLTELHLNNNNISYIQPKRLDLSNLIILELKENPYLTIFPDCTGFINVRLMTLDLSSTSLDEFPNLQFLGETLTYLTISNERFITIPAERLSHLSSLSWLSITSGQLQIFPELNLLGSTLVSIDFRNSNIDAIPTDRLAGLTLDALHLSECTMLGSIPDLCPVMNANGNLYIQSLSVECDCGLAWLLDAVQAPMTIWTTFSSCSGPPHLPGRSLSDLTYSDLQCEQGTCIINICN